MFVSPDTKRKGSFNVKIPTLWSEDKEKTMYFGARHYAFPKLSAQSFVTSFLCEYYGSTRAKFILTNPQFVKRMKFGCQVNVMDTFASSRGRIYPKIAVTWTEFFPDGTRKRKQKTFLYSADNKIQRHHEASLFAARTRARLTFSNLDTSALNFEYDLSEVT